MNALQLEDVYHVLLRNRVRALLAEGVDPDSANEMCDPFADVLQVELWRREETEVEAAGGWPPSCQPPTLHHWADGEEFWAA